MAKAPEAPKSGRSESLPKPRKRSLTVQRASISSRRSSKESTEEAAEVDRSAFATPRPTGVPLEAFAAEVMQTARWELFEQRTEPHFRVFVQVGESTFSDLLFNLDSLEDFINELFIII